MKKNNSGFIFRFIRLLVSVLILSAFIISIAFFVRGLKNTDENRVASAIHKVLGMANINVDQNQVQQVAGDFIDRLSDSDISSMSTKRDVSINDSISDTDLIDNSSINEETDYPKSNQKLQVAIISDVHQDLASLQRSLLLIKEKNIDTVFVIGDLTDYGDIESLNSVKKALDNQQIKYHTLPGDHDLAQSVGPTNYIQIFGDNYYNFNLNGSEFLFLDNSANFTQIEPSIITWFNDIVDKADFVVLSQPLYTDDLNMPFKNMYMGSTFGDVDQELIENQNRVKLQRDSILDKIRQSDVTAVIAGDHHKSNSIVDPVNTNISHNTIGSISSNLNGLPQRLIQTPRFSILTVFEDGTFELQDITID